MWVLQMVMSFLRQKMKGSPNEISTNKGFELLHVKAILWYCGREKIKKYAKRYEKSIFQFFFIFLRKIGFFNLCYGEEKEERKTKKNKR